MTDAIKMSHYAFLKLTNSTLFK